MRSRHESQAPQAEIGACGHMKGYGSSAGGRQSFGAGNGAGTDQLIGHVVQLSIAGLTEPGQQQERTLGTRS